MIGERPLRVWSYRGWCWICRRCHPTPGSQSYAHRATPVGDSGCGYDFPDQPAALEAALSHRHQTPREAP